MSTSSCPVPFLEASNFGTTHGYIEGRLCAPMAGGLTCCLPCPITDWVYPDNFTSLVTGIEWLAVISTVCCAYLLLSWAVLPVEKTNRHYLSICYTIGVLFMNLSFVLTLAAKPEQCFDAITANDMKTSKSCGASASLLILGGWCSVMWCFLRSLSLHLQICWQIALGQNFVTSALVAGWGIPIIGIVLALVYSGTSFRFGATCHINHKNSLADLWIPLLTFSGVTLLITLATFGYCVNVYLQSLGGPQVPSANGSALHNAGSRSVTPHEAYRRIQRVVRIQWRGIALVLIMVIDVIFFSIVLVFQDQTLQDVLENPAKAEGWVTCLVMAGGDKNKCLNHEDSLVVNEATIGAVLVLLTLNGLWLVLLLGRFSMLTGWVDIARSWNLLPGPMEDFASSDNEYSSKGLQPNQDRSSYEMLTRHSSLAAPAPAKAPMPSGRKTPDNAQSTWDPELGTPKRNTAYNPPPQSFSSPRPPVRMSAIAHSGAGLSKDMNG